ncbi:MAG: D-inositol-3-phosphate glycosyltransferase [Nocardioidaceae bacterium]|jgi:D-inositol-3-phosphate glycosyltransferase|nr:D-inositol-3-phosphate glycosyltransferase [Nocardioidaceae bacterium]
MTPSIERVAMISLHTSPLDQPGTGDAGGMNVYVLELSRRLAQQGVQVDMFTRATSSKTPAVIDVYDGIRVHNVVAGPFEGLAKDELPSQLCTFAREVLRAEAARDPGYYDVVHSHYWLSGQVGALTRDRWAVPLVHTMHTMAKVKNAALARGDSPEPAARLIGEEQVVAASDMLVANTDVEYHQLVDLYGADPDRVEVVHPGVDLEEFRPFDKAAARARLGLPPHGKVIAFIGRIQPLKAPDIVLKAAALLGEWRPELAGQLTVAVIGGPSGTGLERPESLASLAHSLQITDSVRFVPPVSRAALAQWMAAADVVCVPSYNESFGLVAIEAQAVGTPVVAAAVGGLTTAVADSSSGILIDGHDVNDYAKALEQILLDEQLHSRLSEGAVLHAAEFGWERTAKQTLEVYQRAATNLGVDRR